LKFWLGQNIINNYQPIAISNLVLAIGFLKMPKSHMKEFNPKMHTAEHILNQTMIQLFKTGRCFSAHIEDKKSKCDYHFDRALSETELKDLEDKINEIINLDLPVQESFLPKEEAMRLYNLERLPEGTEGDLRIIKVGDYDAVPCVGPHVQSTKEIGQFKLISSDFNDGVLRIRYKLVS
jgi:Ser-tRNA(Ala) deacylase AlaX